MPFTDRDLVAYVDGELPAAAAKAIADACATDAALAGRVRQLTESRDALRRAFDAKVQEPVPDRLLALLREPATEKVVNLPQQTSRSRAWIPLALAASVALAVGVGLRWRAEQNGAASAVAVADDPQMQAHDRMLQAPLDQLASGVAQRVDEIEIMPTASLIDAKGRFCREYEASRGEHQLRGLACREPDRGWVTQVAKAGTAPPAPTSGGDEYQPASGAADDLAGSLGSVTRMTPAEEQLAIGKGWGSRTK